MRTGIDKDGNVVEIDESSANETYFCKLCKAPLVRKMGEIKAHHFAHKKGSSCDTWSYEDNEWIEAWKSLFDKNVVEIPTGSEDKHFIDVKYDDTIMMFFSSLNIKHPGYETRKEFYHEHAKRVIWVFDCSAAPIFYDEDYHINFRLDCKMSVDKGIYVGDFYFKHAGRIFKNILDDVDAENWVFLQINDHFMIMLMTELDSNSGGVRFEGYVLPLASFFKIIKFKDEFRSKKDIAEVFKDFSSNRAKSYDLSKLKTYISAYDENKRAVYKELINKYKNNEIYVFEFLRALNRNNLPSEEEPYFVGGEYSDKFEQVLIDKVEREKREEEERKRWEEQRKKELEEAEKRRKQAEQYAWEHALKEQERERQRQLEIRQKQKEALMSEKWRFCYRIINYERNNNSEPFVINYILKNKNNELKEVNFEQACLLFDFDYEKEKEVMKQLQNEAREGLFKTVNQGPVSVDCDSFFYKTYDGVIFNVKKYSNQGYITYYPDSNEPLRRKNTHDLYTLPTAKEARKIYFKLYFMIKYWKLFKIYSPSLDDIDIPDALKNNLKN